MASEMRDENPIQLLEEAVHLLRRAPAAAVAAHLAGSVPFLVGFLFFVTDMSRSREAVSGCVVEALGMAALFIWMVCWKAVFAGRLRRELEGTAEPGWTLRRACRLIAIQGCAQGVKLFVLPAALLALVPAAGDCSLPQHHRACGRRSPDPRRDRRPIAAPGCVRVPPELVRLGPPGTFHACRVRERRHHARCPAFAPPDADGMGDDVQPQRGELCAQLDILRRRGWNHLAVRGPCVAGLASSETTRIAFCRPCRG